MHVLRVLLLLSCSLSLSGAAVILEGGMPIMWGHTVADGSGFENVGGKLMPNPWHFLDRMNLYRALIASTNPRMSSMGTGETQSPLWGLPLQLGWMFNSGRLEDPAPEGQCGKMIGDTRDTCISPNSWYSCFNYFSSVLPFLSAVKQEIMGEGLQVEMKAASGVDGYCTTYDDCKTHFEPVMTKWDDFFRNLKATVDSSMSVDERKDEILGHYWAANMASTHASSVCDNMLPSYSGQERAFAESWKTAAEFVAAVHFQSSLQMSSQFMGPLPGRVLTAEDTEHPIPDFTAEENHALSAFSWMQSANSWIAPLGGSLTGLWSSLMCSVETRNNGRDMLTNLMTNSSFDFQKFGSFVTSTSSCSSSN